MNLLQEGKASLERDYSTGGREPKLAALTGQVMAANSDNHSSSATVTKDSVMSAQPALKRRSLLYPSNNGDFVAAYVG